MGKISDEIREGSSPRMRGAQVVYNVILWYGVDHPRVCGEHLAAHIPGCATPGSSPRMRGALRAERAEGRLAGIIPAYAGSTSKILAPHSSQRDHPRVCGEHLPNVHAYLASRGSSPRMRGAHR